MLSNRKSISYISYPSSFVLARLLSFIIYKGFGAGICESTTWCSEHSGTPHPNFCLIKSNAVNSHHAGTGMECVRTLPIIFVLTSGSGKISLI